MNSPVSNLNGNAQLAEGQPQGCVAGSQQRAALELAADRPHVFADAKIGTLAKARSPITPSERALESKGKFDRSVTVREKLKQCGLQRFFDMPGITDVRVNQPGTIITESSEGWKAYPVPECNLQILRELANAASIFNGGTALDEQSPIKSVRMPDGQRGQIVIHPGCERDTVAMVFRIASSQRFSIDDYVRTNRLKNFHDVSTFKEVPDNVHLQPFELDLLSAKNTRDMRRFFELCIEHKLNICMSGGVGSGKTTFMKALADLVPANTCIITIEDTHELDLPLHWNKVHLFYGDFVTPKQQLKNCMRMKPDRIFLTELRGDEAFDYIAALNTGHPGSLTTAHANDPIGTFQRIATLIKQSEVGLRLDWDHIVRDVTCSLDVVCQFEHTKMTQLYFDPVRKAKMMRGDKDV
ncbi:P-type DNA transfer ATPase VirB11 [Duganella rhizosphaerae]|uniref:P-type DNA transfer ATPase VirB11 n=1 Tax=Duganella rhizosphaerae TaxID=2885763 RepID=UPI0030EA6F44